MCFVSDRSLMPGTVTIEPIVNSVSSGVAELLRFRVLIDAIVRSKETRDQADT
jgi:hypothetical protein